MNKLFDLTGRLALVTGSSRGIGYAIAEGYLAAGARVIVNGRDKDAVAAAVKSLGGNAAAAPFDVTDKAAVEAAVGKIEKDIGPIDILVNNAGMTRRMPFTEFPEADWRQIMATNLDSVFFVTQSVARRMIPRSRGKIVNICSVMSELGRPTIAPYTASKGAVKMLTKAMCAEFAKHGITANGISPGYFGTELNQALMADEKFSAWVCARTPAGRWGKVEELQGAAIFLASDASSFVNGHILFVDGGMTAVV
ncbi:MAG TPA: glucose 1-dehydrogenase [Xanthobacteraceae bacterium]|nr:glucose 1-dehydrogenase [Xanthobacteraceae bacterium]